MALILQSDEPRGRFPNPQRPFNGKFRKDWKLASTALDMSVVEDSNSHHTVGMGPDCIVALGMGSRGRQ